MQIIVYVKELPCVIASLRTKLKKNFKLHYKEFVNYLLEIQKDV